MLSSTNGLSLELQVVSCLSLILQTNEPYSTRPLNMTVPTPAPPVEEIYHLLEVDGTLSEPMTSKELRQKLLECTYIANNVIGDFDSSPLLSNECHEQSMEEWYESFTRMSSLLQDDFRVDLRSYLSLLDLYVDEKRACELLRCGKKHRIKTLRKFVDSCVQIIDRAEDGDSTVDVIQLANSVIFLQWLSYHLSKDPKDPTDQDLENNYLAVVVPVREVVVEPLHLDPRAVLHSNGLFGSDSYLLIRVKTDITSSFLLMEDLAAVENNKHERTEMASSPKRFCVTSE